MRSYERSGVIVDQCTDCRGIFLDRGELDRLIDAENAWADRAVPQSAPPPPTGPTGHESGYDPGYRQPERQSKPYKKRRSFLEDLFD